MSTLKPPRAYRDPRAHFEASFTDPWYRALTALNATFVDATAQFYRGRDIAPVLMPITVGSVSSPMGLGSDSLPVDIDLFGVRTYLADSMQFQLEYLLRHDLRGAYYVMPTFRGEDPDATHLNQFFHSEAEILGGLDDVIALVESYVRHLCGALLDSPSAATIQAAAGSLDHLEKAAAMESLPQVTFAEALALLPDEYVVERAPGVPGITRAGEQRLLAHVGGPLWLTRPPQLSVPFYQAVDGDGNARCADLLLGIGEVVGAGERHTARRDVETALALHQVDPAEYGWYLRMKEDHPLRTAGFGLGVERFQLWVLGHDDIRDLHVMPRLKGVPAWV